MKNTHNRKKHHVDFIHFKEYLNLLYKYFFPRIIKKILFKKKTYYA